MPPSNAPTSHPITLVTGAGSGIGRATAVALARAGHGVALVVRKPAPAQATADLCVAAAPSGTPPPLLLTGPVADVAIPDANRDMVEATVAHFGRLNHLVANAAVASVADIAGTPPAVFRETLHTNTLGPAYLMHYAWPHLATGATAARPAHIVLVGSLAVYDPFPGFFAYAASKAALSLMAVTAAAEGQAANIRACCLAPGAVETPMLRSAFDHAVVPPEVTLTPEAVAEAIVEVIANRHPEYNGRTVPVLSAAAREGWLEGFRQSRPSAWMGMTAHGEGRATDQPNKST